MIDDIVEFHAGRYRISSAYIIIIIGRITTIRTKLNGRRTHEDRGHAISAFLFFQPTSPRDNDARVHVLNLRSFRARTVVVARRHSQFLVGRNVRALCGLESGARSPARRKAIVEIQR